MLDDNTEDIALNFGDETQVKKKKLRHPVAAFFHIIFRLSALIFYFITNLVTSSFVTGFVIIILLLSFDFWVVKNVTGRLLVGLRWWNYIDEDGNSQWMFEAKKRVTCDHAGFCAHWLIVIQDLLLSGFEFLGFAKKKGTSSLATDSRLFWLGLIIFPVIWVFLFVVALISLKLTSLLTIFVAISLTSANLVGYVKCKKDSGKEMKSMAGNFLGRQIFSQMLSKTSTEPTDK